MGFPTACTINFGAAEGISSALYDSRNSAWNQLWGFAKYLKRKD
jgi:hypothetical protein